MVLDRPARLVLWVLALSALLAGSAEAAWYFVAPDGSDGASGRSIDAPFETVQKALEEAGPGDTVLLQPGHYPQDVRSVRAGHADAPIRLVGSANAVITGAGSSYVIELRHSHLHLSDFAVDGRSGEGTAAEDYRDKLIYAQGGPDGGGLTGLRIQHLSLRNARGECVRLKGAATGNEIADNDIAHCGLAHLRFDEPLKNAEAIYLGTAPEQVDSARLDRSTDNRILRNRIRDVGECIDIKEGADRTRVAHNVCLHQKDPESAGINVRSNGNRIEHNLVDHSTGAGIRLGGDDDTQGIDNRVRYNRLQYNAEGALKIMRGPQDDICGNVIRQPARFRELRYGDGVSVAVRESCSPDQEAFE